MSKRKRIMVTCPACGKEAPFVMWDSINTEIDPEMKAAVRDTSAFRFICPECGNIANVDYQTLYHQMEDKIMIYYVHEDEVEDVCKMFTGYGEEDDPVKELIQEGYLHRVVTSQRELIEKLAIFDAGLDDRIIEIAKVLVMALVRRDFPDMKGCRAFFAQEGNTNEIVVMSSDGRQCCSELKDDIYGNFVRDYGESLGKLRGSYPIVNQAWAADFLDLEKGWAGTTA